jgi:hypothetical protein
MLFGKKRNRDAASVADLIERFLDGRSHYRQEWNDFVDASQRDKEIDAYRRRCYELDPLVNRPDPQDVKAIAELRKIVNQLRQVAESGSKRRVADH